MTGVIHIYDTGTVITQLVVISLISDCNLHNSVVPQCSKGTLKYGQRIEWVCSYVLKNLLQHNHSGYNVASC